MRVWWAGRPRPVVLPRSAVGGDGAREIIPLMLVRLLVRELGCFGKVREASGKSERPWGFGARAVEGNGQVGGRQVER